MSGKQVNPLDIGPPFWSQFVDDREPAGHNKHNWHQDTSDQACQEQGVEGQVKDLRDGQVGYAVVEDRQADGQGGPEELDDPVAAVS